MTHPFSQRRLGEILVEMQVLDQNDLELELKQQKNRLGQHLIERKLISEDHLARALADQFHMDYVDLTDFVVPADLFEYLSADLAYQYNALPFKYDGNQLKLAIADPFDLTLPEKLERVCGTPVSFYLSSASAISEALQKSKGRAEVLRNISEDFRPVIVKENEKGIEELIDMEAVDDQTAPVIKLVNSIISASLQKRASDIHIEAYEKGISVKYRVDGVLYPATEMLDKRHHSELISRLKIMAELDIAEKRIPQDGRFKLRIGHRDVDFRVSILPSVYGEDVVVRILDKTSLVDEKQSLQLEILGMEAEVLKKFRISIREPYGMVLITGPTGSGKTTTLYAAINELNSGEEKIITIEDPVEYQLDGIIQIPVNEKKNLTFAKGLRSILRHDPDKIMVGEIRDEETAEIAVQSALTGHLVFTTVHANNVFDVISRFSHMGIDVHNFVSALNCVMAQRLVRVICTKCKTKVKISQDELEMSGLDIEQYANQDWYQGVGCHHCNGTGYHGRAAITEFLDLSPRIRDMIVERKPVSELIQAALAEDFITLRQSALTKALAGETTLKEINRVTFIE